MLGEPVRTQYDVLFRIGGTPVRVSPFFWMVAAFLGWNLAVTLEEGLEAYATIDAGPNVHVLTHPEYESEVTKRLKEISTVRDIISTRPGKGAEVTSEGLF